MKKLLAVFAVLAAASAMAQAESVATPFSRTDSASLIQVAEHGPYRRHEVRHVRHHRKHHRHYR